MSFLIQSTADFFFHNVLNFDIVIKMFNHIGFMMKLYSSCTRECCVDYLSVWASYIEFLAILALSIPIVLTT